MAEAAEQVETEVTPDNEHDPEAGNNDDTVEQKARDMGWVPKEEFKGDPSRWVSAERFVERGENEIPLLKANQKRLESQIRQQKETLQGYKQTLQEFSEHHKQVYSKAYEKALSDLKKQRAEAIAAGDSQAFEKADEEMRDMESARPKDIKLPDDEPQASKEDQQAYQDWVVDNDWYEKDTVMAGAADSVGRELWNDGYRGKALLKEISKRIKQEFPHKFKNPKRDQANSVEGAPAGSGRGGKKGYADLPQEAKTACDRFVKQGLMKQEQYVKEYFGEEQ